MFSRGIWFWVDRFFQLFFFSTLKTLLYWLLTCIASDKKLAVIPIFIPLYVKVLFSPQWLKAYTFNKRQIWENRDCSMSAPNFSHTNTAEKALFILLPCVQCLPWALGESQWKIMFMSKSLPAAWTFSYFKLTP